MIACLLNLWYGAVCLWTDGKILVEDIVKLGSSADVDEEHPADDQKPAQPMTL